MKNIKRPDQATLTQFLAFEAVRLVESAVKSLAAAKESGITIQLLEKLPITRIDRTADDGTLAA